MNHKPLASTVRWLLAAGGVGVLLFGGAGCDSAVARYEQNRIYWARQNRPPVNADLTDSQKANLVDVMAAVFGTPDEPQLPAVEGVDVSELIDLDKLHQAAGPVGRDEQGRRRGLFREHCVHCHGVSGNGRGPTAPFLNPYPRDFTAGVFKFKSTPGLTPPTHEDLTRILYTGVAGTAMPSFKLLDGDELQALVHYVKYLSLRGEVERRLISALATDLEEKELLFDLTKAEAVQSQKELIHTAVTEIAEKWRKADGEAIQISQRTATDNPDAIGGSAEAQQKLEASIERGRQLFYGPIANCVKCHGDTALGDGVIDDYDNWTKEIEPTNPEALQEFLSLGALPPRPILPRNLRSGVYRGGRRPVDIFWRIRNGIAGSPMPAQTKLTDDEVWDIVNYVRSLPYEAASQPRKSQAAFQRDRS